MLGVLGAGATNTGVIYVIVHAGGVEIKVDKLNSGQVKKLNVVLSLLISMEIFVILGSRAD